MPTDFGNIAFLFLLGCSIVVLRYIFKKINSKTPPYHLQTYWESRYAKKPQAYEWYLSFAQLQAADVLPKQVLEISDLRFLEIGCGSSCLAKQMAAQVPDIDLISIDYSDAIIQWMRKKVDPTRSSKCNETFFSFFLKCPMYRYLYGCSRSRV